MHPSLIDSDIINKEGIPLFVTIGLYYGGTLIAPEMTSKQVPIYHICGLSLTFFYQSILTGEQH